MAQQQQQPKTVLLLVKAQRPSAFLKLISAPNTSEGSAGGARGRRGTLAKTSVKLVGLALEKLLLPYDRLIVLLIQPPPRSNTPDQLRQYEERMQAYLRNLLHKSIHVAAARNIRVEVVVQLRGDGAQAILSFAGESRAAIVAISRPDSRRNFLRGSGRAQGWSPADVDPGAEALARALPSSCKVMVAHDSEIVQLFVGEVEQGPEPMNESSSSRGPQGPLTFNSAMLPLGRGPSATTVPAGVLREVRGEVVFSWDSLAEATSGFSRDNVIGKGGTSIVYRGVLGNRAVAIKRLVWWAETAMSEDLNLRQFVMELSVMRNVRHPNLLELRGVCVTESELLLVFDHLPHGSLAECLRGDLVLTWQQRLEIAVGVARALLRLHSHPRPIIHRDVKSANILLDENLTPKVADFGLAKITPEGNTSQPFPVTFITGTDGYLAPEYRETRRITKAIDVFAFGVVLLELVSALPAIDYGRRMPYLSRYGQEMIMSGAYWSLVDPLLGTEECDHDRLERILMVAVLCLAPTPDERPNMDKVTEWLERLLQHPSEPHRAPEPAASGV